MVFEKFISDESGGVSVDWVVLTAALVGTGLAVISTVSQGIEALTDDVDGSMRGQIIRTTFSQDLCEGGLYELQRKEDNRVASAIAQGDDPSAIDVEQWMIIEHGSSDDEDLLEDYQLALAEVDNDADWDRARTLLGTMECELAKRGLL